MTANTGNVALRVPNAKIPLAVVTAAAIPITATSANLSGAAECTSAEQVHEQLHGRISIIVDGGTSPRDIPSTIIDLTDEAARWRVMREGRDSRGRDFDVFCQRMKPDLSHPACARPLAGAAGSAGAYSRWRRFSP